MSKTKRKGQTVQPSDPAASGGENVIELRNVCKGYEMGGERLEVLKSISLSVKKGEFMAILGPSGSGKSTLMNIIGCMDKLDSGEYILDGREVQDCGEKELTEIRNRQIGFVFQKYHLIPKYTVVQNIMMPLLMRGMRHRAAQKECMETIQMLGLTDRLSHKPNELSGGQQQRVAIARALVGHPSLLLADEPTGALDSATGLEVLQLFRKLNELGHTIIVITHDLSVASHARRTVKIVDGQLFE